MNINYWIEIADITQKKLSTIKNYIIKLSGYLTVIKIPKNLISIKDKIVIITDAGQFIRQ